MCENKEKKRKSDMLNMFFIVIFSVAAWESAGFLGREAKPFFQGNNVSVSQEVEDWCCNKCHVIGIEIDWE